MNIVKLITSSLMITIFAGCKTSKHTETTTVTPKTTVGCGTEIPVYETDVKPILEKHCNRCHGDLRQAGGLDFTKMENIKSAANKGELLGTIKWAEGYPHMPARADKLDEATIHKIECWVLTGMK